MSSHTVTYNVSASLIQIKSHTVSKYHSLIQSRTVSYKLYIVWYRVSYKVPYSVIHNPCLRQSHTKSDKSCTVYTESQSHTESWWGHTADTRRKGNHLYSDPEPGSGPLPGSRDPQPWSRGKAALGRSFSDSPEVYHYQTYPHGQQVRG